MNKLNLATLMLSVIFLSSCDEEPFSCSSSAVVQRVVEHARNFFTSQAVISPPGNYLSMSEGEMYLKDTKMISQEKSMLTCEAKLHVKMNYKLSFFPRTSHEPDPTLNTSYSVQETADHKEYYVAILSVK